MRRSRSARCSAYGRNPRRRPVGRRHQQFGQRTHVAQRERQALAVHRVVVSARVAGEDDPVRAGLVAPGLVAAECPARSRRRDRPRPSDSGMARSPANASMKRCARRVRPTGSRARSRGRYRGGGGRRPAGTRRTCSPLRRRWSTGPLAIARALPPASQWPRGWPGSCSCGCRHRWRTVDVAAVRADNQPRPHLYLPAIAIGDRWPHARLHRALPRAGDPVRPGTRGVVRKRPARPGMGRAQPAGNAGKDGRVVASWPPRRQTGPRVRRMPTL